MTESFRERLRRLRRDEAAVATPVSQADARADAKVDVDPDARVHAHERPAPESEPAPRETATPAFDVGTLHRHLARRIAGSSARLAGPSARTVRGTAQSADGAEMSVQDAERSASSAVDSVREIPRRTDLGPPERLAPSRGGALARTTAFERAHVHGTCALADGLAFDRALMAASARDERFATIDLERAVYLDTETSGLSGGSGTYVFLVGLGTFDARGFEVWQGFLSAPKDERALLAEAAERIADASAIVSFFGKSFDRHRLEDKMRVHGVKPPFAEVPHLDLYWPLRRAHQGRFENCRLKTLERELAGVVRDDDLPGSFAPAAWFDFLAERPHMLEGVFRHNLEDVLSLVALLPHAAALPAPKDG